MRALRVWLARRLLPQDLYVAPRPKPVVLTSVRDNGTISTAKVSWTTGEGWKLTSVDCT